MKKILIFYGSYGGGHLSAASSMKEFIDKNYSNVQTEMIDCIEYINKLVNKLSTKAYSGMAKRAPWAWKRVYKSANKGVLSKVSNASNYVMSNKLFKLISQKNPDLIISTHPFSSQMCAILKRKGKLSVKVATIMTDYHIHSQWLVGSDYIDFFFVSNQQMKKDLCAAGIDSFKVFVTGIPISERFSSNFDRNSILQELGLKDHVFTVLFFAGGAFGLGKTRTFEIFKTLLTDFPEIQIIAISGKNEKMKQLFTDTVASMKKENVVKIIEFSKKVPELMSISDLIITKPGGLTTSESLAAGLPILVINPIPGQEEENAAFLEESHAAVWLKKHDDISKVLHEVISSPEKLEEMKKNSRMLAKKSSTADICNVLFKLLS